MARPKTWYVCSYDINGQHSSDYTEIRATRKQIEELKEKNRGSKVYFERLISALYFTQD